MKIYYKFILYFLLILLSVISTTSLIKESFNENKTANV